MQKPAYTITELEAYLRQKKTGYTDPLMQEKIQEDAFLQTIVIGLEKTMAENKNTIAYLEKQKQKNWSKISPILFHNNNETTILKDFKEKLSQYFSLRNYDPQYLRIHLLLGLNCSCIIVLAVVAFCLNSLQDSAMLVSHLEELAGYKP